MMFLTKRKGSSIQLIALVCWGVILLNSAGCGQSGNNMGDAAVQADADRVDAAVDGATDPDARSRFEPFAEAIESLMASEEIPGVAVAILEGGEVAYTEAFGHRGGPHQLPMNTTTLFSIASVTKMMTAVAL